MKTLNITNGKKPAVIDTSMKLAILPKINRITSKNGCGYSASAVVNAKTAAEFVDALESKEYYLLGLPSCTARCLQFSRENEICWVEDVELCLQALAEKYGSKKPFWFFDGFSSGGKIAPTAEVDLAGLWPGSPAMIKQSEAGHWENHG